MLQCCEAVFIAYLRRQSLLLREVPRFLDLFTEDKRPPAPTRPGGHGRPPPGGQPKSGPLLARRAPRSEAPSLQRRDAVLTVSPLRPSLLLREVPRFPDLFREG